VTLVDEERSPSGPVHRRHRWRRVLRWTSATVVVIVVGVLLAGYFQVHTIDDSIHRVPVTDLGKRPPVYSTSSMNILVFGSDSRSGLDHHMQVLLHTGDDSNSSGLGNTDTIMVVHISPGRHKITVMSIPRDTMVPYYQCDSGPGYPGQQADPGNEERINALFAAGGPSCLWKTVEQQTGIHIDHFIEIGLAGFVNVVNDVGGVNVCAPFPVDDPVSGLELQAGEHHIDGVTALDFWRTREDIGEGSDLQRIQRDQFMSAQVVKGVLGGGLLSNPIQLLKVLNDAAPNLTTDSGTSLTDLLHIGESLRSISGKNVQFVTTPNEPYPLDPNATVQFAQPQASELFAAIAHDTTIPKSAGANASPAASPSATPSSAATSSAATASTTAVLTGPSPSPSASPSASSTAAPKIGSIATSDGGITAAASCGSDAGAFEGPLSP
jgi:LCP family protein required for cell wall assembly